MRQFPDMALTPGTRLGPYEIMAPLGAGGMGEVYRARDRKLERDVALKILPEVFASDPERLARFEREAKTLASLNHPNIAQIHGFEQSDPSIGSGHVTSALVMELVEGEDLSQYIARGPIPIDDALPIARQIAEALETAHEQGIVHRDLKPANVKVRDDGTVKVLDFGLAKALDPPAPGSGRAAPPDALNSPTITSPMTLRGTILGTAAYMAPEQAKGRPLDKRADIWAFGCVFYEMLAGRGTFAGESVTDILSAVTRDEPDWSRLPADTPVFVRALLERCLRKDPNQRLRDIGEARVALSNPPAAIAAPAPTVAPRARAWRVLPAIAVAAAVAAVAGFTLGRRGGPITQPAIVTSFTQLTEQPGFERQPTISPDGRSVVYVSDARGNADLYLLRVGGRNAAPLTADSPTDDYAPAFARDGNRIAFRSERAGGGIFVMEATGESVRRVSDFGFDPHWSPDGTALVVAQEAVVDPMSRSAPSELWVVSVADGTRRRVSRGDAVGGKWSPSGRRLAYWGRREQDAQRDIHTVASDGSQAESPVAVTDDAAVDWSPVWSPDGRFLYFASNRGGTMNLWRVSIDEASGRVLGAPEPLTTPTAWSGWFDITADGQKVVFGDLDERASIWVTAFDPVAGAIVGQPRAVLQGRAINSIDLSPDGQKIAFAQRGQPWEAIGVIRVDGSGWSRLTDDDVYHRLPAWAPDSQRMLFYMNRGRLGTVRDDGSGLAELATPAELQGTVYPVWSPDGARVALATDNSLAIVDMSSSPIRLVANVPTPAGSTGFLPFSWSPDGRWLAGTNRVGSNRDQIFVSDATLKSSRLIAQSGKSPAWLPDSRRVLFSSPTDIVLLDAGTGRARALFPHARTEFSWGRLISLSRDGRTLAYLGSQSEGDVWLMTMKPAS